MKRFLLTGVLLLAAAVLAWTAHLFWPKTVNFEAQGMKYRLGAPGSEEERLLTVRIKGNIYRENLRGDRRFKGTIELEGEENPVPANQRQLEIRKFRGFDYYWIVYAYVDDLGRPRQYAQGNLFMNDGFDKVAITLFEQADGQEGWSGASGLMIAAPASDREEALAVANEVMRGYLNGYALK
jgi:hypothetical protein